MTRFLCEVCFEAQPWHATLSVDAQGVCWFRLWFPVVGGDLIAMDHLVPACPACEAIRATNVPWDGPLHEKEPTP